MIRIKTLNIKVLKTQVSLLCLMIVATNTSVFSQTDFKTNFRYCFEENEKLNVDYLTKNISVQGNSYSDIIKVDVSIKDYSPSSYFAESIFNYLFEGDLTAYSIVEKSKLTVSEIKGMVSSIDTVISFNPVTFEERVHIVESVSNLTDCGCYKIEQLWSKNGQQITASIIGITPIISREDGNEQELFWIPVNQIEIENLINNPSISWVKMNSEYMPNEKSFQLKKAIWDDPKNNKTPIYEYHSNPLPYKEKLEDTFITKYLLNPSKDTVVTFNPETLVEKMSIYENEPTEYEDVKYLKIHQIFYIDDITKSIGSKLIGLSPVIEVKNAEDNVKYTQPLYQIIFDEKE